MSTARTAKPAANESLTDSILRSARALMVDAERTASTMSHALGLPVGLSDQQIHVRYAKKPMSTAVNALVHLQLGTRMLEYLTEKRIINYGLRVYKVEEAMTIVRANRAFIDRVTRAHERGRSVPTEIFVADIKALVKKTVDKLAAILVAGKVKLGSAESELATTLPYPLKVNIALLIDNLCKMFDVENEIEEKCNEYIVAEKNLNGTDLYADFLDYLKVGIWWGNGTKSYQFIRVAVASFVSLSRDNTGVDKIHERVRASIDETGTLDNANLEFEEIPEFEEKPENMHALFPDEEVDLNTRGGSFAIICAVILDYHRKNLEFFMPDRKAILDVAGRSSASEKGGDDAIRETNAVFDRIRLEVTNIARGYVDGSDGRTSVDRARDLRERLERTADILQILAKANRIQNQGRIVEHLGQITNDTSTSINDEIVNQFLQMTDEDAEKLQEEIDAFFSTYDPKNQNLNEFHQMQIRCFYLEIEKIFRSLVQTGVVRLNDKEIMPSETRLPYFRQTMLDMHAIKKDIRQNLVGTQDFRTGKLDKQVTVDNMAQLAEKMLAYLNNVSIHAAKLHFKAREKEAKRAARKAAKSESDADQTTAG